MESFLHPQPLLLTRKLELPVNTSALQQAQETWVSQDRHIFLPTKWVEVKVWLQGKDGDACSVMHGRASSDVSLQKDFIAHILNTLFARYNWRVCRSYFRSRHGGHIWSPTHRSHLWKASRQDRGSIGTLWWTNISCGQN